LLPCLGSYRYLKATVPWQEKLAEAEGEREVMDTSSKQELYELIEALPEAETLAVKRFLEFLLQMQKGEEYFSPEDIAEIEGGFAQIKRGEYVIWEEFKRRHGL
jgi:hypothetical protein